MNGRAFRPVLALLIGSLATIALALGMTTGLPGPSGAWAGAAQPDATVGYVAPGANCGAATPCYATIQAAVDAAAGAVPDPARPLRPRPLAGPFPGAGQRLAGAAAPVGRVAGRPDRDRDDGGIQPGRSRRRGASTSLAGRAAPRGGRGDGPHHSTRRGGISSAGCRGPSAR
jgi:hypothetical protein